MCMQVKIALCQILSTSYKSQNIETAVQAVRVGAVHAINPSLTASQVVKSDLAI